MMKRFFSLLLIFILLLSGCAFNANQEKEPVSFYYLRQHAQDEDYDLFFSSGAIGAEERDISGHRDDLNYLLTLYMQGPMDSKLAFPFPLGSKVLDIRTDGNSVTIVMNAISSRFNEMDVTVSCACIAKTCMELVDAAVVTVESHAPNDRVLFSRTFTNENLILEDTCTLPPESTEDT